MKITRTSPIDMVTRTMDLDISWKQWEEWTLTVDARQFVQDIFPNLTPDQREFIMTGITPEQWEALERDEAPEPEVDCDARADAAFEEYLADLDDDEIPF